MAAISRLCPRSIWLEKGQLRAFDSTSKIVEEFISSGDQAVGEVVFPVETTPTSEFVRLLAVRTKNARGAKTASFSNNETPIIEIEYETLRNTQGLRVGLTLVAGDGSVLLSSTDLDVLPEDFVRRAGRHVSRCQLPAEFFNNGRFHISVGSDFPMLQSHFHVERVLSFTIEPVGGVGQHIPTKSWPTACEVAMERGAGIPLSPDK